MNVIGVRFKEAGKIYYFDSNDIPFALEDKAILETENGLEIGLVAITNVDIKKEKFYKDLCKVHRKATEEDLRREMLNKIDAKSAKTICQEKADYYNLDMKVVDAEYTFDRSKITFYFVSANRVDFRELVKDLATTFKNRIELRQIGVRDHAKIIKHYGTCGQQCCCSRHLTQFSPLSIRYAKDQNISLDPGKISGVCGRLMCCLAFEEENYSKMKKIMPKYGQKVKTCDGIGTVISNDFVREECKVRVSLDEEENVEKSYKICELEKFEI